MRPRTRNCPYKELKVRKEREKETIVKERERERRGENPINKVEDF